jgi:hypothetical protein
MLPTSEIAKQSFPVFSLKLALSPNTKHFDHIRSKLRPHGLNAYRVTGYGYVLLAVPEDNKGP